jgi:branched-chain amino acid transport system substrate-binding protein
MSNLQRLARAGILCASLTATGNLAMADEAEGVTDTTIFLGTSIPLTGPVAPSCKPVSDGALAWFKSVNAKGGVHGRLIENIVLDDAYKAPEALANGRELAAKPVFAFFGGCGTLQPPALLPIAQQDGILYLFPFAGLPQLAEAENAFILLPQYAQQFDGMIPAMIKKHGGGRVYAVLADVPGSDKAAEVIKKTTEEAGGVFLGTELLSGQESDLTPLVLKLKDANTDYVALNVNAGPSARMFKAMQANNAYPNKFVLSGPVNTSKSFLDPAGGTADDKMLSGLPIALGSEEKSATCVAALKEHAPDLAVDFFSLWGCATAQIMTTALDEAGKDLTRAGFSSTLRSWAGKEASPLFPPLTFTVENNLGIRSMFVAATRGSSNVIDGEFDLPAVR